MASELSSFGSSGGSGGFSFGTQSSTPAFGLPAQAPATTASSGFSFNFTPKTTENTTVSTGSTLSVPAKTNASTGFSFGAGLSVGAAAAPQSGSSTGFSFGLTPATSGTTSTGLTLGTATTTTGGFGGFNFGGIPSTTTASTSAGCIFSSATTSSAVTGLGGIDPTTSSASAGTSGGSLSSDGKALKEMPIPDQLVATVEELQKFVKEEKTVREDIVHMSSKPMLRVQEDIAALRQLLSVVSNGLQRNAHTLEKLKSEMTKDLKNAEMAHRTKDIPPGLQYENTAPSEYFEQLVEQFEARMVTYRQQIEMLENHLAALHQPARHSPAEIFTLVKRMHETFVALAAQLQQVHEAIKSQKEQFLTYRRVFHGDMKDIFEPTKTLATRPSQRRPVDNTGPTPFLSSTNAAAAAMASILTKQQPHGPPVSGLLRTGASSAWPNTSGISLNTGLGHLGSGSATSFLGQPVTQPTSAFSYSSGIGAAGVGSNSSLTNTLNSLNNTASSTLNMSAATKQPFMLQKPPQGAKRGKR